MEDQHDPPAKEVKGYRKGPVPATSHWPADPRRHRGVGRQGTDARPAAVRPDPPRPRPGAPAEPPYTYVTKGIEHAVEQARTAAAGKDVVLMGATVVQQCLRAGLLDELIINLVPVVLGHGVRLLDDLEPADLDLTSVIDAPGVTHLTYRVRR